MLTTMRAIRIGECIYCRTRKGALRREHLIAAGLNGPWVLQEATCGRCADTTSAFEGQVLGPVFRLGRAGLRMHMGERPTTLPLLIDRGDGLIAQVDLPVEDHPAVVQFLEFLPPAYLDGRQYGRGIDLSGHRMIQVAGPPAGDVARRLGAKSIRWVTTFLGNSYPRLIAKIAYTFVVADVGLQGIETAYVVPAILGQTDDIGRWVGCDGTEYLTDPSYFHGVAQQIVDGEIIVRVRLFARYRAPEYVVVVGRLRPGAIPGKFRVSGPEGVTRSRLLAEVVATAQKAPEPFMPSNQSLTINLKESTSPRPV